MRKPTRAGPATPEPRYTGPERRRFVNRSWPLPAFAAWAAAWVVFAALQRLGAPPIAAFAGAGVFGAGLALIGATPWRRLFIGCGFPLSFAMSGSAGTLPAWVWLLALALLALVYPFRTWRDAPLFPTPRGALAGLGVRAPLEPGARVLDGGCGLGAGLIELRREYPDGRLDGIEWSLPLRLLCALRCRHAAVRRGDLWRHDWSPYALVYLFQRPESMQRAVEKAARELSSGAWLASLEFEARSLQPEHVLDVADGRRVWLYRAPFRRR